MRWRRGARGTSPRGSGTPPRIRDSLGFWGRPGEQPPPWGCPLLWGCAPCSVVDAIPVPLKSIPPPYPRICSPPWLWGHPAAVRFCSPWIRAPLWDLPPGVGVSQPCRDLLGYNEDLWEFLGGG